MLFRVRSEFHINIIKISGMLISTFVIYRKSTSNMLGVFFFVYQKFRPLEMFKTTTELCLVFLSCSSIRPKSNATTIVVSIYCNKKGEQKKRQHWIEYIRIRRAVHWIESKADFPYIWPRTAIYIPIDKKIVQLWSFTRYSTKLSQNKITLFQ